MLLSPGTEIRQALFPPPPPILKALSITAGGTLEYLLDLVRSPQRLSALVAIIFTFVWLGTRSHRNLPHGSWIFFSILAGLLLSFASLFPAVYATSELPAPRTLSIFSFIIVASFLYAGLLAGKWLAGRALTKSYFNVLILGVGISILFSTAINAKALYDSRDIYSSFARRWDQADAQIVQARNRGEESVTIPALNVWTGPGGDPTDNPRYWVTACTSRYYDVQVFGPPLDMDHPETQPND
jgi:hypothetical protein